MVLRASVSSIVRSSKIRLLWNLNLFLSDYKYSIGAAENMKKKKTINFIRSRANLPSNLPNACAHLLAADELIIDV